MAFEVRFFKFSKRENSTALPDVTGGAVFQCVLKEYCSLDRPSFLIELQHLDGTHDPNAWPDYNYCWVKPWGKYFFVEDWTNEFPHWRAQCRIDVLASYKSEILASTQYVSYSSVSGGTWLPDTRIPVLKNCIVNSASAALPVFVSGGLYILSYIGKVENGDGGSGLVALGKASLVSLITSISTSDMTQNIDDIVQQTGYDWTQGAEGGLYYLTRVMTQNDILGKAYQTAPSCLRSCIYTPLKVPGSASQHIYLGNYDTGVTGIPVNGDPITGSVSVSIPWYYSDWRRAVCEQVYLYLPLVGMVNLSSDSLTHASSITVNYSYTLTDATIAFQVVAGGEVVGTYGGSCAINYPLGINQQASAGQVTQAVIQGLTQTASAGITGNVAGVISGIAATAYNAMDVAATTHPSSVGGIGGGAGSGLSRDVVCYTVAHDTIVSPSDMASTMGVPTMKPVTLSSCSGYCQCVNAHIAANATLEELNAITAWLNSGFYIE